MDNKTLARELWQHKDVKLGYCKTVDGTLWAIFKGSEQVAFIERTSGDQATVAMYAEIYDANCYYLEKSSHYTYKVASEEDILAVLNGKGTIYCC